jgi:hypothetical protein
MLVMTHVDVRSPVQYAKLPAGDSDIAAWSLRESCRRQDFVHNDFEMTVA